MDNDKQNSKIKASPAARRIARELGLDLQEVAKDVQGRVQINDVELYHQKMLSTQETVQAEIAQIDQEIQEEELVEEDVHVPDEITEVLASVDTDALNVPENQQEMNTSQDNAKIQENLPEETQDEDLDIIVPIEEGSEPIPVSTEQNIIKEMVEPEPELPIMIEHPNEPILLAETNEPEPIDESIIQVDEMNDPIEEDDDEDLFIPPIPISISFRTSDLPIRNMLSGLDVPLKEGLINAIVKACCSAFAKAEISLYESRVNLVTIKEKGFEIQTASNFENHKISELEYNEAQEDDDILINIWDMTDYEFNSIHKADVDSVNLFILWDDDKITVDLTCDEFIMEIGECTYYMHMLKKYLDNPILMLL